MNVLVYLIILNYRLNTIEREIPSFDEKPLYIAAVNGIDSASERSRSPSPTLEPPSYNNVLELNSNLPRPVPVQQNNTAPTENNNSSFVQNDIYSIASFGPDDKQISQILKEANNVSSANNITNNVNNNIPPELKPLPKVTYFFIAIILVKPCNLDLLIATN